MDAQAECTHNHAGVLQGPKDHPIETRRQEGIGVKKKQDVPPRGPGAYILLSPPARG